tara:strand:+ start:30630 stop:30791 length:162 start_codon:yes stop_codon:yes gene_type:complete
MSIEKPPSDLDKGQESEETKEEKIERLQEKADEWISKHISNAVEEAIKIRNNN